MKALICSSMKLSLAVGLPLALFSVARHLAVVQDLLLGLKALSIQCLGTPAQYQALVGDTAREFAARGGTLESYLAGEKLANALRAVGRGRFSF